MYNTQKNFIHRENSGSVAINLVTVFWVTVTAAADCKNDYSPCICTYGETSMTNYVTCNGSMADVAIAFQSKPALDVDHLALEILPEGDYIPADLLGESRISSELQIFGQNSSLIVDSNAFRSSKNSSLSTTYFYRLDMSRMDFDFLIDFPNIWCIFFKYVKNLDRCLPTLPPLPSLSSLSFYDSSDLNKAFSGPVLECNGIRNIIFDQGSVESKMDDEGMSALMNWLLPSSANTLKFFYFFPDTTSFTRTPSQLGSFRGILDLMMIGNRKNMTITEGSIFSNNTGMIIDFNLSNIMNVEENAFLGNYAGASIGLGRNYLTRFEAGAFKSVLEQMTNNSSGYSLELSGSPFDCYTDPCHLAWITRDNRNLFKYVRSAKCNGGEYIEDMSPTYFTDCP